jgi:hypothetical protein
VSRARRFLERLQTDERVPDDLRSEALQVLRHFPGYVELDLSADALPAVWGSTRFREHGES